MVYPNPQLHSKFSKSSKSFNYFSAYIFSKYKDYLITCFGMKIYTNSDVNVSLICDNSKSSNRIYGACERIDLYADNARSVAIQCIGSEDCHTADFYLNNAQDVNILNHGYRSAYYANYFLHNVSNQVLT